MGNLMTQRQIICRLKFSIKKDLRYVRIGNEVHEPEYITFCWPDTESKVGIEFNMCFSNKHKIVYYR